MRLVLFCYLLLLPFATAAQRFTLTGLVKNGMGQSLPLANVLLLPDSVIATADEGGRIVIGAQSGVKKVIITYTGFETLTRHFRLDRDTTFTFVIKEEVSQLREVTVNANRYSSEDLVQSTRTGTTTLTPKDLNSIPVLGGEADVIKTLQLLPGAVRGVEGSSDLFVRGGAADQNLVLLDGAPIYNTSHMFGFLSVFNPSTLDNVESINGGFPAEFGGRLSSILNVTTNRDITERTKVSGDIGLIASRLYLEQPLIKDKASFWIAGRRTYIDQVVKIIGEDLPYFFYDLNGKLILRPSNRTNFEFSFYNGEDILDIFRDRNSDGNGFLTSYRSGNNSQSFRWAHSFPSGWRSSFSAIRSSYDYTISNIFEENQLRAFSDILDYSAKIAFGCDSLRNDTSMKFGFEWARHGISPSVINTMGTIAELLESSSSKGKLAHELALYAEYEFVPSPDVLVTTGFRASAGLVDGKNYFVPEPRFSLRYATAKNRSIKFSYSRMAQYMHRISNSAVTTPADVWYTVTRDVRPQTSHQVAAAWQQFLPKTKTFISAELYYKSMDDLIGYEEGTNLFFNTDFESKLVQGAGRAYGLEFLVKKEAGKFTGWISYTLSWSRRQFDEINKAEWFPSRYDRRHNGAIVTQYAFGKRWAASIVWEFISGARFTPVVGQYVVVAPTLTGVDLVPIYSGINQVKLADSHRLDVGIKFMSKPERRFQWQWFIGAYNLYNRASPLGMFIEQNEADGSLRYMQPGLFGTLPFISYGFKL